MDKGIKKVLAEWMNQTFNEYGLVIACIVIGMIIGWSFKAFIADRKYEKQVNLRISEKDTYIQELKGMVYERLKSIKVDDINKSVFNKIKRFFRPTL